MLCWRRLADFDGDGSIGFRELMLFCTFEFFTCGAVITGEIDRRSLTGAVRYLGLPADFVTDDEVDVMLMYANGSTEQSLHSVKSFSQIFQGIRKLESEGFGDMVPVKEGAAH